MPWTQTGGYSGEWLLFPLLLPASAESVGLTIDVERNRRRCPRSWRELQRVRGLRCACFSWLGPGTHVVRHVDRYYPGRIRAHVGLRSGGRGFYAVQDVVTELRPDDVLVMDGQVPHETANLSSQPRINLIVDVQMTPLEERYVASVSPPRRRAIEAHARAGVGPSRGSRSGMVAARASG